MKIRSFAPAAALVVTLLFPATTWALGTYATGQVLVQKLTKIESRGIIWESFEGEAEVLFYNSSEKCVEKDYQCYTPVKGTLKFSVRPENAKVVNFLRKQKDKGGFLLNYRVHRFEAAALEENTEILDYQERVSGKPAGLEDRTQLVEKPGSRSFSVHGRILDLADRGTLIKTYEGLYEDTKNGKVHAFSINDEKLAQTALKAMTTTDPYYMGISVAVVSVWYSTDHFLFEINFKEEAGGVVIKKEEPKTGDKKEMSKKEAPKTPAKESKAE